MYTSALDYNRKQLLRTARNYLFLTVLCASFGAVYEHFSFGVYSWFMLYAFAVPLLLGCLPFLLLGLRDSSAALPPPLSRKLWHAGTAALTTGCIFRGILEIYGTASELTKYYWLAGGILLATALVSAGSRRAAQGSTS